MAPEQTPGSLVLVIRLSRSIYRRATEDAARHAPQAVHLPEHPRHEPRHGPAPARRGAHLDPNNTVLMLNDLEAAGWAERRRDPEDRRRHIVEITPAGRKALARADRALDGLEDDVLDGLSPEERATLRDLLARAMADVPPRPSTRRSASAPGSRRRPRRAP